MASIAEWWLAPGVALLRHPLLLAQVLFVAALLLFPLLRVVGAPLLVWHERASVQRIVGATATFSVAHAFFVVYLLERESAVGAEPMRRAFVALWVVVVLVAAALRLAKVRRLTPRLRALHDVAGERQLGALVAPYEPSPMPLVGGVAVALVALAGLAGSASWLARELDRQLAPALGEALRSLSFDGLALLAEQAPSLHLVALLSLLGALTGFWLARSWAPPMAGLILLITISTALGGASQYWLGIPGLVIVLVLLLLWRAGKQRFAIRVPELEPFYQAPSPYPPERVNEATTLLVDRLLETEPFDGGWPGGDADERRPLILVCTSGGGIRAATWTAGILGSLSEQLAHFHERTLLVTGASGGMVGGSAWLGSLRALRGAPAPPGFARALTAAVGRDSLTELARAWFFADAWRTFSPSPNRGDRGRRLQERWQAELLPSGADIGVRLAELRDEEARGRLPTFVYAPMIVEDGRRLLLSNASLARVVRAELPWVARAPGQAWERSASSTSAYHLHDLNAAAFERITLATAARLSASFPYVSPATVLPTAPRVRLVDAGYYDNYGVNLVAGWLREALEHQQAWLERHVSRILVIQIRDEPFASDEPPNGAASTKLPPDGTGFGARLGRALEGLTSPLEGLFAARDSAMRFRNDAELDAVSQAYASAFGAEFVLTQVFELKGELSLSWYLTRAELALIDAQLGSTAIQRKLADVADWADSGASAAHR
jgi:hypothetical protein